MSEDCISVLVTLVLILWLYIKKIWLLCKQYFLTRIKHFPIFVDYSTSIFYDYTGLNINSVFIFNEP